MHDVVTFESKSYYGESDAFKVAVRNGNGSVPVFCGSAATEQEVA